MLVVRANAGAPIFSNCVAACKNWAPALREDDAERVKQSLAQL